MAKKGFAFPPWVSVALIAITGLISAIYVEFFLPHHAPTPPSEQK